jgi:hypothetical protein
MFVMTGAEEQIKRAGLGDEGLVRKTAVTMARDRFENQFEAAADASGSSL